MSRWLRAHTGADLARRAGLLGLAAGPVRPSAAPGAPGHRWLSPGLCLSSAPARAVRPLAGLLVADFSALWAGPLCAHLLGLAGARVVKVETPWRPDGARRGNAGFYDLLHAGHRSVVLDPHTSGGRAAMAGLVAAADIVIESSRPRALARFGLDAGAAVAQGATWVSITAYGRASDRAGFGDDVAAASGLVAADTGGSPVFCGDAIADPLTGLTAALRAACAPAGGALLDIAMADVVAATLARSGGRASGGRDTGPGPDASGWDRGHGATRAGAPWPAAAPGGQAPAAGTPGERPPAPASTPRGPARTADRRAVNGKRSGRRHPGGDPVGETPGQRRRRVKGQAGQGEVKRAPAADATGDADRAARARDQSHAGLGQPERGCLGGHHRPGERGQLDARAHARTVHAGLGPGGEIVQEPGGSGAGADEVRGGRVRGGAELVQVAAGAKARARPVEHHPGDGGVGLCHPERVGQRVPQAAAVGVAPLGTGSA